MVEYSGSIIKRRDVEMDPHAMPNMKEIVDGHINGPLGGIIVNLIEDVLSYPFREASKYWKEGINFYRIKGAAASSAGTGSGAGATPAQENPPSPPTHVGGTYSDKVINLADYRAAKEEEKSKIAYEKLKTRAFRKGYLVEELSGNEMLNRFGNTFGYEDGRDGIYVNRELNYKTKLKVLAHEYEAKKFSDHKANHPTIIRNSERFVEQLLEQLAA